MGIRNKTLLIVLAFLAVAVGGFLLVAQTVLLKGFTQVESAEMTKNVQRAVGAVDYNLSQMSAKGTDWSGWSETYKFVQNHNQDYIDENLATTTITDQGYNFLAFYNKAGKLVDVVGGSIETGEDIPYPASLQKILTPGSALLAEGDAPTEHQGVIMLPEGPLMIVTSSINDLNDTPAITKPDGTIVFGTYLNDARTTELGKLSQLPLKFYAYNGTGLPSDVAAYQKTSAAQQAHTSITPLSDSTVAGYNTIKDIFGQPAVIVRVEQPRSIYSQGQRTLAYFLGLIAGVGILLALVLALLLNRFVVSPVTRLARDVAAIEGRSKESQRVNVPKQHDEVGRLASGINTMLGNLDEARTELENEKSLVEQKVVERTQELANAQAELAASVRSLPFGFAVVNHEDEIVFSNALLAQLVKHTIPANPAASKKMLAQINTDYSKALDILGCIHEAQAKGRPIEKHVSFGSMFFRFFFMPVVTKDDKAEKVLGTVLLMEDVTEEKAAQRSRDEFFSIASHELRTPLTAIRGNSDMILNYYPKELKNPELKGMVDDIHGASLRLIDIVNVFLDVSRLEMGKVEFKPETVDVPALVTQILHEFEPVAKDKKLQLSLETTGKTMPSARADQTRLRQILVSLVDNAVKFTDKGAVTIRMTAEAGRLKIAVTDAGKGIPLEQQHLLFHKFQQAGESILTREDTQSTGLGLYISKLLAEGMHGTMTLANSEVGKGSTFVLELPLADKK